MDYEAGLPKEVQELTAEAWVWVTFASAILPVVIGWEQRRNSPEDIAASYADTMVRLFKDRFLQGGK